ncbi:Hsp20/alpha crystallin family protein [Niallia sp. XMNu-256]|uniref:Hsp20/alpha crystallin family protein n=1 Tax=Niallia sp. XMNu-256 TaxID=3082444 RepID=UPI0030D3597F
MMNQQDKPLDIKVVEKWLESFFLDPLTSYLDETIFRIDLFETADEYIIEALLPKMDKCNISIKIDGENIIISSGTNSDRQQKKQRTITFPFNVTHHEVKASFNSGILEVFISKSQIYTGKSRFVPIS